MRQKKSKNFSDGGYCCPSCGKSATEIVTTMPFATYVLRKRRCLLCNELHETAEMLMDSFKVLKHAYNTSIQ